MTFSCFLLLLWAACTNWYAVQMYQPPPAPVYAEGPKCRVDMSLIPSAERSRIYATTSSANLQCGNMLQCYNSSHDTAMANGAPFERHSEINCEQCLKRCEEKRAPGGRYECLSVVYDYVRSVCDLYSVTGNTWPQCLASMKGYVYFRPTGHCVSAPEPQLFSCQLPRKRKMILVEGSVSTSPAFVPLGSHNKLECLKACQENREKGGNALTLGNICRAAMYAQSQCQLSPNPLDFRTLKEMPGGVVAAVKCFQDVEPCPYPFRVMQQRVLVGHAKRVTDAGSLEDCIQQCLSVGKFHCKSGMFFLEDHGQNCILNTETASSKRSLFTPEEQYTVYYFDLTCNPDISWTHVRAFREANAPAEVLFEKTDLSGWTDWSPCSRTTFTRYRYKQCGLKDIRRCEREAEECVPDV